MNLSATKIEAPVHNEVVETLLNRRSCRAFLSKPIPREVLETVVKCGQFAATARGLESWHLVVVADPGRIEALDQAAKLGMRESGVPDLANWADDPAFYLHYHAPAVVLACHDGSSYSEIDCANAIQNMCVAAASLGLGSCYNGLFRFAFSSSRGAELRELLRIPAGYTPTLSVALGYADGPVKGNPVRSDEKITWLSTAG